MMQFTSDELDDDVSIRMQLREKISSMSFEEISSLKNELGGQTYNEALFGVQKKPCIQKRLNKNRPVEVSSKIRPEALAKKLTPSSYRHSGRDPRFDHLCGEFNAKKFNEDYKFIKNIKTNEKQELKKQLNDEISDSQKEKISFLIARMENQEREEKRLEKEREKKRMEYEERIQLLSEGKKPYYAKKSEKRVLDLVKQYEDLKKKGKVVKVIEKYRKKKRTQDRKKLSSVY